MPSVVTVGATPAGTPIVFNNAEINNGAGSGNGTHVSRFQIDLSSNGTWDVTLDATHTFTALGSYGGQELVSSPAWTAIAGSHKVRMCADGTNLVAESNESNNCGIEVGFTIATSTTVAPTCKLSVSPSVITPPSTATLVWSSTNATAGTINYPGTSFAVLPNGSMNSAFLSPYTTTYTGKFTGAGGTAACSATLTIQSTSGGGGVLQ
jgi:hypothetical protein